MFSIFSHFSHFFFFLAFLFSFRYIAKFTIFFYIHKFEKRSIFSWFCQQFIRITQNQFMHKIDHTHNPTSFWLLKNENSISACKMITYSFAERFYSFVRMLIFCCVFSRFRKLNELNGYYFIFFLLYQWTPRCPQAKINRDMFLTEPKFEWLICNTRKTKLARID